jgi:hypothetical protein
MMIVVIVEHPTALYLRSGDLHVKVLHSVHPDSNPIALVCRTAANIFVKEGF